MPNLLPLIALAALQVSNGTYSSERFGFRIERPDDWGYYASESIERALFAVSMYPRGSSGVPSLTVYVASLAPGTSAEAARDAAVAAFDPANGDIRAEAVRLALGDAPGIAGRVDGWSGGPLEMRYAYASADAYLYTLECAWTPGDEASERALDGALRSFALFPPQAPEIGADEARWRELAGCCGSEIAWAPTWDEAARRAGAGERLVFVVFENFTSLDLPETAVTGPLMDRDLLAYLNERFVAWRMDAGDEAPFRAPEAFGLSTHSWGEAFLVVTPDGKVLRDTGISDASWLAQMMREAWAEIDRPQKHDEPLDPDPLECAAVAVARGRLGRALEVLANERSARSHAMRAAIYRRQRKGPEALEELERAARARDEALAPDLAADEALVRMRMGEYAEAQAGFERVLREHPESPRCAEALFWLGAFERLSEGASGTDAWQRLVDEHPDDPFAWKAAANLLGAGSLVNGGELLEWPDDALVAAVEPPRPEPLPPGEHHGLGRVERAACEYLVLNQRDDGSWMCPTDAFSLGWNLYTPAVTAICGASLLEFPGDSRASKAAKRALAYSLASHASGALDAGEGIAGVYSIWGRTFVLSFLCRARRERVGDAAELDSAIAELVASIEASQHEGGGWPYVFFPGDPEGVGFDPSATFLTAGVVLALFEARALGAKVSEDATAEALRFLDAMRLPDGSYRYMPAVLEKPGATSHPEAAGRGPLCALALLRGGACELERVREALELFVKHRSGLAAEWHKELCHTGPDGQGSHYLFYDYRFAAEALAELPETDRAPFRAALLDDVLAARFADGSFQDMPGLGRAYGTAMAVLTLRSLRGQ